MLLLMSKVSAGASRAFGRPRSRWGRLGTGLLLVGVAASLWRGFQSWRIPVSTASAVTAPAGELAMQGGRLVRTGETVPFTGWMEERHAGAGLKSRTWIGDGRLEGVSEGWFTNGVIQVREYFVGGISEGPVTRWHGNGAKQSEGTARAGKLEGPFRRWHDNGVLAEELFLRGGQPQGLSRAWFPSGYLKAEVTLNDGKIIARRFWKDGERPPDSAVAKAEGNP